tara:strand:- start:976 stop:1431 length:456 start_codon:yes stop_codon:yes gene_type:complete
MASQADKDHAAAKAKQNNNNQAAKDHAAAKAKQNGGDGGTSERMSRGEAAAGLNLAGNDPMSGRGQPMPTMSEREEAAGLNLAGNDPMSGRSDSFYVFGSGIPSEENTDHGVHDNTNETLPFSVGSFSAIVCVDGKPFQANINGVIGAEIE